MQLEKVKIDKLVHGGQGLGVLPDGQKIFIWNALPGETVAVRVGRKKRGYAEGFAEEIVKPSKERINPVDEAYLSTSPWQIMTFEAENKYKKEILIETFSREGIELPKFRFISNAKLGRAAEDANSIRAPRDEKPGTGVSYGYRNKMEYSFWGDEDGLHIALFHRASHGKRIVQGSSIARPEIDKVANNIVAILNKKGVRASSLKTIVLRSDKKGNVAAALFVKTEDFPLLNELKDACQGIEVIFSNPKSPASVITKSLYVFGDINLKDELLGQLINYNVNSFFQVNLPIFETTLQEIKKSVKDEKHIVDMYAGVGTIGLIVGADKLVELDSNNVATAKKNITGKTEVIQASTEQALEHITHDSTVIFDPPRAGLHSKVIDRLLEVAPKKVVYLSCNPSTQARDLSRLQETYKITSFTGYNFFPRTPHIESLVILESNE